MVKDTIPSAVARAPKPRAEQGRSSVALSATGMGEFEWNRNSDRFVISDRLSAITGIPAGTMRAEGGHAALDYIYPDDVAVLAKQFEAVAHEGDRYEVRFRLVRPDLRALIWVSLSAVLIRDARGQIEKVIGVVRDVSGRKADEDERDALILELDHRVKNVLDSVQSLASQSARRTATLDVFLRTFSGRLDAMAAAHTLLTTMRRRGADINHIVAAELAGMSFGRAHWEGPGIVLMPKATHSLTLALHELATNAVKFGALSVETGRVHVAWRSTAEGGFALTWTESGGPAVAAPTHRGFGAGLLRDVTGAELGGVVELDFKPDGLRASLSGNADAVSELRPETISPPAPLTAPDPFVVSPEAHAQAVESAHSQARFEGKADIAWLRVLIVEDSALLTRELKKDLKARRAKVIGVVTKVEDAERFLKLDFDVAVLDADLNGQSVRPISQALFDRDIPFVFTVGAEEGASAPRGFDAPTVRKPYTVEQIAAAICRARDRA